MSNAILRLPETIKKTGLSRSTIYLRIKSNSFPEPVNLGERSIGFIESEIDDWIEQRMLDRDHTKSKRASS